MGDDLYLPAAPGLTICESHGGFPTLPKSMIMKALLRLEELTLILSGDSSPNRALDFELQQSTLKGNQPCRKS
jgi:hypothetical protein